MAVSIKTCGIATVGLFLAFLAGCAGNQAPVRTEAPAEKPRPTASAPTRKASARQAAQAVTDIREHAGEGTPSAIDTYLRLKPQALATPNARFGQAVCAAEVVALYGTPKHIILEFAFATLEAPGNCSADALMSPSTLESPMGPHKFMFLMDEKANFVSFAAFGRHYAFFDRRDATDDEARQAVINLKGTRPPNAFATTGRYMGTQHLPALRAMFELQASYQRAPSASASVATEMPAEFVDKAGVTWSKCPATDANGTTVMGTPAQNGKCPQPVRLNYFEAVEFAAKAGNGWRLPSAAEAVALKNEAKASSRFQSCRGIGCNVHYSNYMREHFLSVLGEFWGDTIYLKDDKRAIRSQEVLGTAITTDIHMGGNWPVTGFDQEPYQKRYMVYLVKSNALNANWERTKSLVASQRPSLEKASATAKAEEARREAEDRAALGAILFAPGGGSSSGSAPGGAAPGGAAGARFSCQYKCTNSKLLGSDKSTLSVVVTAASERAAVDQAAKHADDTCYRQTQRVLEAGSVVCRKQ